MKNEIDFLITWVDGDDPEWKKEFCKYRSASGDTRKNRYRDWGILRYMFRAFEYFTPWVRKIHFVTHGHLPEWLNINNEKLCIVKHTDFINVACLPTFNSHPLEINMHRIKGLADKFVYFNDDTFILDKLPAGRFFFNGLPRDMLTFNCIFIDSISHIRLNDILIINKHFRKKDFVKKHLFKLFSAKYGLEQIRSLLLLPWPQITGFYDHHQPQAFLKNTFEEVWDLEEDILKKTSLNKFRSITDVNQYLFRYWQLMKGNFEPISFSDTTTVPVRSLSDIDNVCGLIKNEKYKMLCINDEADSFTEQEFEIAKNKIVDAFELLLPKKSSFEND